jgi:uncharacterized tellurite resistance protein B-like protein
MEFRPFWELLEDLGIALPEPAKIKRQEQFKPIETARVRSTPSTQARTSYPDEVLQLLGVFIEECTVAGKDAWIHPEKTVRIDRYTIPGMVYVGDGLMSIRSYTQVEPCLIRPKLKVQCDQPDYEGKQMRYQPSYTQMKPASRAAYLQWLSEGRRDPTVHISYVWLFFYGLERRVFHDLLKTDRTDEATLQELGQIIAEVEHLLGLYGDRSDSYSGSFGHKAGMFLDICQVLHSSKCRYETMNPAEAKPLPLQIALGQLVKQGQPLSADWALAWHTRLARKPLRMVATRCMDEFQELFQLRYAQWCGKGLMVEPGTSALQITYYPSNPSFGRSIPLNLDDLPDVTQFSGELRQIGELVEACTIELEPLGRLLGRNPSARHTSAAITLLPAELLSNHGGAIVANLQNWLTQHFARSETQTVITSGKELLQYWSGVHPEKLAKAEAIGLSHVLEQMGYGIEPDPRFGGVLPTLKNSLVLFRLPRANLKQLSTTYIESTLIAHLAIAVANGNDIPTSIEQQYLKSQLGLRTGLQEPEQSRLYAHLHWLLENKPTLRNLKSRIDRISPDQRKTIARFLVKVAAADGQPNPQEVRLLEKAYGLLELDGKSVYSDIHDFSTTSNGANESIDDRSDSRSRGHQILSESNSKTPRTALSLDMTLVRSKLEESQEISKLLADIFADEPAIHAQHPSEVFLSEDLADSRTDLPNSPESQTEGAKVGRTIAGLDCAHSELLFALMQRPVWQREELVTIATQLDLMLDGALEVINDVAFDRCDEAVIEGDECLEVNGDVLRELLE